MAKRKAIAAFGKPDFKALKADSETFTRDWWKVEFYLRTEVKNSTLKKEAIKWMKANKHDHKSASEAEDWRFIVLGKLCYVLNREGEIPPTGMSWIEKEMPKLIAVGKEKLKEKKQKDKEEKSAPKKTIQDYLREKAGFVAGEEFEPIVDKFIEDPKSFKATEYDPLAIMRKHELSQGHARHMINIYERRMAETAEHLENFKSKELREYLGQYTEPQYKQLHRFYEKIVDSCNILIANSKAKRKTRKKVKAFDPAKEVSKLKLAKEDKRTGLASINPVDIIGAKEAWFYNPKTRKLGKFVALDSTGLGVKGASIENLSVDKSIQKTLRKPVEQIREFKTGGIRKFNKQFGDIKGVDLKIKTGRTNVNTVIFKVFK
jgi:hypothetical protein